MQLEVLPYFRKEFLTINPKFGFPDAGHVEKLRVRDRFSIGHMSERCVAEDDVWWYSLLIGQTFSESPELLEEKFVTVYFPPL